MFDSKLSSKQQTHYKNAKGMYIFYPSQSDNCVQEKLFGYTIQIISPMFKKKRKNMAKEKM